MGRMAKLLVTVVLVLVAVCDPQQFWSRPADAAEIKTAAGVSYEVFVTGLNKPRGLLIARSGALYAVEQGAGTIVKVYSDRRVSRIAKGHSIRVCRIVCEWVGWPRGSGHQPGGRVACV